MNYSAEQNVIGALFLDSTGMDRVYRLLSAEMFEDALLGRMYLEFQRAYDNHYQISPAVMIQKLSGGHAGDVASRYCEGKPGEIFYGQGPG